MTGSGAALWRDAPAPAPALQVVVVVPVRNEAERLLDTLQSLAAQRDVAGQPVPSRSFEVLLLANNCDDGSAGLARSFAAAHPAFALHVAETVLPAFDAHIGHVRKLLMDAACHRLAAARGAAPMAPRGAAPMAPHGAASMTPHGAASRAPRGAASPVARGAAPPAAAEASVPQDTGGVVASTDGDTVLHPQWLVHTLHEFAAGADAVGGRIALDPRCPLPAHTLRRHRCDTVYRLALARLEDALDPDPADPWPRHHQHFCASLAVSRRAYLQVGGVPAVRYLEDEALVAALRADDLRIRHSPQVCVCTSPRAEGRVEVGLSWQLRQWSQGEGDPRSSAAQVVDAPDELALRWWWRRRLRMAWQSRAGNRPLDVSAAFAAAFGLDGAWLLQQAETAPHFGRLWAAVQARLSAPAQVPVRQANDRLRSLIRLHSTVAAAARSNTSSR